MSVLIVTSLGDIVIDLHADRCPLTCKNFLKLCKIKYYNGCLFHSIQKDYTAQTGDPTGTGTGGDSIYKHLYGDQARFFGDEMYLDLKHSKTGTVSMASAGENLNASQFYFTLRDELDYLDGKHTVFGEVAEGLETLARINEAYVDEKGRPYKNIRIKHTYILDDPFEDPPQLADLIPDASPEKPKDEVDDDVRLEDDWVPMDEQVGIAELQEIIRAKEAHSSAVVLESIGDIPDAELKPPDNVLFVCKLNPVTEDEDLHTIFSRFGIVIAADIIRDFKTGDSLCYAFIEFEDKDSCEQAYFKMDNALIDDRRIHVDFSQSVAKLWSQYRRKDNQKGRGGGCFKCGALDHIAKDCTGGAAGNQQLPKYILKDDNVQHGGNKNSGYGMVFDKDATGSPRSEKERQDSEQGQKQVDKKPREHGRKDVYDKHGNRGYRDAEWSRDKKNSRSNGCRRDEYLPERRDKEREDGRDYRKRNSDDGHGERRDSRDREHKDRRERKDDEPGSKRRSVLDEDDHRKRDEKEHRSRKSDDPQERDRRHQADRRK